MKRLNIPSRNRSTPLKKHWSIVFFIQADEENAGHVRNMIEDILETYNSAKNSFHFLIRASRNSILAVDPEIADSDLGKMNGAAWSVFEYSIAFDKGRAAFQLESVESGDKLTDRRQLRQYMRRLSRAVRPKKTMLVTWAHGNFFGIFKRQIKKGRTYGQDYVLLQPEDLAYALAGAFGRKKLSVLLMMNCNTNTINYLFSLAKTIDYLVAPETIMYESGYNYKAIFSELNLRPQTSPKAIVRLILARQANVPVRLSVDNQELIASNERNLLISGINANYFLKISNLFERVVRQLIEDIHSGRVERRELIAVLNNSMAINLTGGGLSLVDFASLINVLSAAPILPEHASEDLKQIKALLNDALVGSFVGSQRQPLVEKAGLKHPTFATYTVGRRATLEPGDFRDFIQESGIAPIEYSRKGQWDNFLTLLHASS